MGLNLFARWACIFVFAGASGCANAEPTATAPAGIETSKTVQIIEPPLAENDAILRLNVEAGSWSGFDSDLPPEYRQDVELTLVSRNVHDKWAPLQSVCIKGKIPGRIVCLRLVWNLTSKPLLSIVKTVQDGTAKNLDIVESTKLGDGFPVASPITVSIGTKDGMLSMFVSEEIKFVHKLDFSPDRIQFGCSSAECRFKLLHLD